MTTVSKKIMGGGLVAAIGLSALSPVQQAGALLSVAGAAMWAAPALAQGTVPGVGIIVKRKPGNAPIIASTDKEGIVRITGLEAGEYEVKLFGNRTPTTMKVGPDGRLAFVARRDVTGGPDPKSADPRARLALPVVREWVEACCDNTDNWDKLAFDMRAMQMPDVNTSNIEQLMSGINNSREAAAFIIAERQKSGPYKDPLDFAQRVGQSVTVDFSASPVRIGDTTIFPRGTGSPKNAGFKTEAGSGVVELYGKKHNYVGHVTLLK